MVSNDDDGVDMSSCKDEEETFDESGEFVLIVEQEGSEDVEEWIVELENYPLVKVMENMEE